MSELNRLDDELNDLKGTMVVCCFWFLSSNMEACALLLLLTQFLCYFDR